MIGCKSTWRIRGIGDGVNVIRVFGKCKRGEK
jgi:hypothetical protein